MAGVALGAELMWLGPLVGIKGLHSPSGCRELLKSGAGPASVAWTDGSNGRQAAISIRTASRIQRTRRSIPRPRASSSLLIGSLAVRLFGLVNALAFFESKYRDWIALLGTLGAAGAGVILTETLAYQYPWVFAGLATAALLTFLFYKVGRSWIRVRRARRAPAARSA